MTQDGCTPERHKASEGGLVNLSIDWSVLESALDLRREQVRSIEVENLAGGWCNQMQLVRVNPFFDASTAVVLRTARRGALRRSPISHEATILRHLELHMFPGAPRLLAEAKDMAETMLLSFVEGMPIESDVATVDDILDGLRCLAQLHEISLPAIEPSSDEHRVSTLLDPWWRMARVVWELHPRAPEVAPSLVHGDAHLGNMLRTSDGKVALIDWEAARVGDPRIDLGWFWAMLTLQGGSTLISAEDFCGSYRVCRQWGDSLLDATWLEYFAIKATLDVAASVAGALDRELQLPREQAREMLELFLGDRRMWMAWTRGLLNS